MGRAAVAEVGPARLPDVVLLDLVMPGGGGLGAIERLRALNAVPRPSWWSRASPPTTRSSLPSGPARPATS